MLRATTTDFAHGIYEGDTFFVGRTEIEFGGNELRWLERWPGTGHVRVPQSLLGTDLFEIVPEDELQALILASMRLVEAVPDDSVAEDDASDPSEGLQDGE